MDIELTIVEVLMTHVIEVEAGAELLAPSAHVRAYLDRCRARPPASRTRRLLRARQSRVIVVSGHVGEIRNPRQRLGFRSAVRVPGLAAATCGTDMHRNAVLGGAAESRHRRGVIRIIDTPTMTRRPAEPRPANTESMEDRTRRLELRGFIVDPTSAHFDWASAECPKGVRLDRLVSAMVTELTRHRPVALGIMMPTWIPVTHKAAAAYAARNLHRDSLLDLHTVFMELRAQIDQLRVFVHWRTFITASGPKLYLWEAFRSEQPAERDLSILLADSMRAIAAPEPSTAVATDDVLSLVGALLLRTALTDDVTVLRTPCALVGQPAPSDPDELRRDKERRDKELIDFLVRQAMATWFRENGRPEIAKLYARDAASEPSPPPVKRGRKTRA